MPIARVRSTDSLIARLRNTDVIIARSSGRPAATTSEIAFKGGMPIGLLMALTRTKQVRAPDVDALGPRARIRNTD